MVVDVGEASRAIRAPISPRATQSASPVSSVGIARESIRNQGV